MTQAPEAAERMAGGVVAVGGPRTVLTDDQVRDFVAERLARVDLDGRSLCVVVPDATRSCPCRC